MASILETMMSGFTIVSPRLQAKAHAEREEEERKAKEAQLARERSAKSAKNSKDRRAKQEQREKEQRRWRAGRLKVETTAKSKGLRARQLTEDRRKTDRHADRGIKVSKKPAIMTAKGQTRTPSSALTTSAGRGNPPKGVIASGGKGMKRAAQLSPPAAPPRKKRAPSLPDVKEEKRSFIENLNRGPFSQHRKAFKLPKSLLPLGMWPSNVEEDFDLPPEWKASALKRMENPPPYRKLKANLYSDAAQKGLVPVDEIPLCHCKTASGCDEDCINRQLLMECAPGRCPTLAAGSRHCNNSAIQTKSFPQTEIFRTLEGRGWGLRLAEERGAKSGTLLHEYLGEVIDMEQCRERLSELDNDDFYFASLDGNLVLDAGPMGSEARFANHSCNPNCVLQKWSVLGETRVVLAAARDVAYGEELTYNYQADTLGGFVERQRCLCGEPQCAGFIGGELVAVKADEWRAKALKVMGQAHAKLETVRALFGEGKDLGFEDKDEGGQGVRYESREMECLSILLKEGDAWLVQLAQVMEETVGQPDACAGDEFDVSKDQTTPSQQQIVDNDTGNKSTADSEPGSCSDDSSTSGLQAGRRPVKDILNGSNNGSNSVSGQSQGASRLAAVDLVKLEKLLEELPSGLLINEAVRTKKMVARASQVARTVWSLLDAASKHGLDVDVPEYRQPSIAMAGSATTTGRPGRPRGRKSTQNSRSRSANSAFATGAPAAVSNDNDGSSCKSGYGQRSGSCSVEADEDTGAGHQHEATEEEVFESSDDASGKAYGSDRSRSSREISALSSGCEGTNNNASVVDGDDNPVYSTTQRSREEGGLVGSEEDGFAQQSRDFGSSKRLSGDIRNSAYLAGTDSAGDVEGCLKAELSKPSPPSASATHVRTAPVTRRTTARPPVSECPETAPLVPHFRPLPLTGTQKEGFQATSMPPKPRMSQVYQVIRSCRGLAPVVIPGASELRKLVEVAEAWAQEACSILRIKVSLVKNDQTKDIKPLEEKSKSASGSDITKQSIESENNIDKHVSEKGKDKEGTASVNKWAKLGLPCPAMANLEEKLQEIAAFSLAREQRKEEEERERLKKTKEEEALMKERQRQAKRDACRQRRRRRERGDGKAPLERDRLGAEGSVLEDRRSPRLVGPVRVEDLSGRETAQATNVSNTARPFKDGSEGGPRFSSSPRNDAANVVFDGEASAVIAASQRAKRKGREQEVDQRDDDEDELHCLCRLPAGAARFRTLMTCDACHRWFHPACVKMKELRKNHHDSNDVVFVCPMCEHARGGLSNFACPPSPGFYVNRRMHRPGLSELEPLVEHANSLPVDGVDGQAYLSYVLDQVVGWRDRCQAAVQDVRTYIEKGRVRTATSRNKDMGTDALASLDPPTNVPSVQQQSTASIASSVTGNRAGSDSGVEPKVDDVSFHVSGAGAARGQEPTSTPPVDVPPVFTGVALPSVGRDLGVEASLLERLGRLVCEGALIEVVDVHKEDVLVRRAQWILAASLSEPSVMACLRLGQCTVAGALSGDDEKALEATSVSGICRLKPNLATLEATLTEGRTLGLARRGAKNSGSKARRASTGTSVASTLAWTTEPQPSLPLRDSKGFFASTTTLGVNGAGGGEEGDEIEAPDVSVAKPSSDPLGAGIRVYARLFEMVTETFQAVVSAESTSFRNARRTLPKLEAGCKWADIEGSWAYARARASELHWQREQEALASTVSEAMGALTAATVPSLTEGVNPWRIHGLGVTERNTVYDAGGAEEEIVAHLAEVNASTTVACEGMSRKGGQRGTPGVGQLSRYVEVETVCAQERLALQEADCGEAGNVGDEFHRESGSHDDGGSARVTALPHLRERHKPYDEALVDHRQQQRTQKQDEQPIHMRGMVKEAGETTSAEEDERCSAADVKQVSEENMGQHSFHHLLEAVGDGADSPESSEGFADVAVVTSSSPAAVIPPACEVTPETQSADLRVPSPAEDSAAVEKAGCASKHVVSVSLAPKTDSAVSATETSIPASQTIVVPSTDSTTIAATSSASDTVAAVESAQATAPGTPLQLTVTSSARSLSSPPVPSAALKTSHAMLPGKYTIVDTDNNGASLESVPVAHAATSGMKLPLLSTSARAGGNGGQVSDGFHAEGRAQTGDRVVVGAREIADPSVYCLCRKVDDGSVMVLCDDCEEWFHARCVGLGPTLANNLEAYTCPGCWECTESPTTDGEYPHRWITDAQVEFSVRQIAPKIRPKPLAPIANKPKKRAADGAIYCNPVKQPVTSPGSASSLPSSTAAFNSKRLRTKAARACDAPGAKKARAMRTVATYIERHYCELGLAWPPERPSADNDAPDCAENDRGRIRSGASRRRHSYKRRQSYHDKGIVGGDKSKPADTGVKSGSLSGRDSQMTALPYPNPGPSNADSYVGRGGDSARFCGHTVESSRRLQAGGDHIYGSTEAGGSALSLLAEVVAGGRVLEMNVLQSQRNIVSSRTEDD